MFSILGLRDVSFPKFQVSLIITLLVRYRIIISNVIVVAIVKVRNDSIR